jgi:hypothetical protein
MRTVAVILAGACTALAVCTAPVAHAEPNLSSVLGQMSDNDKQGLLMYESDVCLILDGDPVMSMTEKLRNVEEFLAAEGYSPRSAALITVSSVLILCPEDMGSVTEAANETESPITTIS